MTNLRAFILLTLLFIPSAFSQSNSEEQVRLSAEFGVSKTYIVDELISKNEYTGYPVFYNIMWEDLNTNRETGFSLSHSKTSELKNRNTTAKLLEFFFEYHYIYSIDTINIFSLPVKFYLGPGISYYVYDRDQKVASFIKAISDFRSFSLNVNPEFILELFPDIVLKINLSSALISYVKGIEKYAVDNSSKLFLFYSYLAINSRISIEYFITKNIFASLQYRFDYLKMKELNKIRSIEDRITLQAGWAF